jgi:hypothetical protein
MFVNFVVECNIDLKVLGVESELVEDDDVTVSLGRLRTAAAVPQQQSSANLDKDCPDHIGNFSH